MTGAVDDQLNGLLNNGWSIAGYSACVLAGGLLAHNILLQKEDGIQALTIVSEKDKEVGRTMRIFSPKPNESKKKGIFG